MDLGSNHKTRLEVLREFNAAPPEAWFGQELVAVLRDCSISTIERDRWLGIGIPFVKCGRSVRYGKAAILAWLVNHELFQSTTQYQSIKEEICLD